MEQWPEALLRRKERSHHFQIDLSVKVQIQVLTMRFKHRFNDKLLVFFRVSSKRSLLRFHYFFQVSKHTHAIVLRFSLLWKSNHGEVRNHSMWVVLSSFSGRLCSHLFHQEDGEKCPFIVSRAPADQRNSRPKSSLLNQLAWGAPCKCPSAQVKDYL